jgi:4-amino-4-deoxy-L-arabinose transferase-like glycosyltransferase
VTIWRPRGSVSLIVVMLVACAIYLPGILSPPSLMDDVDAVQAQIARNMLTSGDWVTARIDGVAFFEKSPLIYWCLAGSYWLFGIHDWAARIPIALSSIALALLVFAFGTWAFGECAGVYSALVIASCVGLWLFTRILIPDVVLTLTISLAMWGLLRAIDEQEAHPRLWAYVFAVSLGLGLLLKSLIAIVFPAAAAALFLLASGQSFLRANWRRLRPVEGTAIVILIAAPWHILAMLRNPPYFAWTLQSAPGHYHGFLWFYVVNEQLLRFLNLRYPRDYNTVPRLWFWLFHLVWLFPWSVYIPAISRLSFRPNGRAGRCRLLALCWIAVVLVFFTFSTTQEYYSMPCYPALALLIGSSMDEGGRLEEWGTRALSFLLAAALVAVFAILIVVRKIPTPGDISAALSSHPAVYSLSLGHMEDLTLQSFAYLRAPLLLAGVAFAVGLAGTLGRHRYRAYLSCAFMMILFFLAARLALVKFDPLLSSRSFAESLLRSPPGQIVVDHHYFTFSSIAFYTQEPELLLNGRWNNFEYGSNAPGAPGVFISDATLKTLWPEPSRLYLIAKAEQLARFDSLVGVERVHVLQAEGGKVLLTNQSP